MRAPRLPRAARYKGTLTLTGPCRLKSPELTGLVRSKYRLAPRSPVPAGRKPCSKDGICRAAMGFRARKWPWPLPTEVAALHHLVTALRLKKALMLCGGFDAKFLWRSTY